jgi:hypothetical protein
MADYSLPGQRHIASRPALYDAHSSAQSTAVGHRIERARRLIASTTIDIGNAANGRGVGVPRQPSETAGGRLSVVFGLSSKGRRFMNRPSRPTLLCTQHGRKEFL